ncbi:MAG: TldD [Candidatus Cloacimonas sp. SDB]|nr:MAG: TldD [Candidatus Cloacimonas sp. SDB]
MFQKLRKLLSQIDADFADIRYEIMKETFLNLTGKELSRIDTNTTDGYVLRILKNGGFSSISFTQPTDAEKAIKTAMQNAELLSKNLDKPIALAKTPQIKANVVLQLQDDPRKIPLAEKLELLRKYNDIPLSYEKIVMTYLGYSETFRKKYYLNSAGSEISEELLTTRIGGSLTSKEGNLTQNLGISSGGSNGFNSIRNLEDLFEKRSGIALDLLKAEPISGGIYNCILNPSLSGVFAHEAFGHFSEADIIETLPAMRKKMQLGAKLGNDTLSITDNATLPDQLGFYRYDDEGVAVRKVELMKNGVLTGRLHSRRTAQEFNEPVSGHCVAEDYKYAPIIRMGTIFIESGKNSFEDLMDQLDNGLYIIDAKGGQTSGENFTFGAQYGFKVKNGKKAGMIRDINMSGNLYSTLKEITSVGNDLLLSKTGGCGKGQLNIRSCHGGPHILMKNVVIGGI